MRKSSILSIFILLISTFGYAEKKIESKINAVTVYVNGAQVYRKAKSTLKKGTNEIIIDDVSPYLNKKSIQASCSGSALILDVKHNIEYNNPVAVSEPLPKEIQQQIAVLNDSIFYQNLNLQKIRNQIANLDQEKRIITNNKTIRGEGKSDSLAIFMQAVEFYHEKLNIIENQLLSLKIAEHNINANLAQSQTELNELQNYSAHKIQKPSVKAQVHQILLTVYSDYDTETTFSLNYLVNRAGWIPSYDLRAKSASEPVNLTYKASIYQKTGEDWNNVNLTLSTFSQNCSFTVPTLAMWEIQDKSKIQRASTNIFGYESSDTIALIQQQNFYSNTLVPTNNATAAFNIGANTSNGFNFGTNQDQFILPKSLVSNMDKTLSNVEFEIKNRFTINSDGKETMLVVNNTDVSSKFDYISVPKLNTDAFLLANLTDWRKLNLLPAKANIYFNNSFVGETEIQPSQMGDTLSLAVGRERGIEITRKKIDDDEKAKTIGSNIKREITIEIAVKNTTNQTAEIELKDQIPVSKSDDIKVKEIDLASARLNEKSGILSWKVNLKPDEGKIIKFTYEITHNKEIEVI